MTWTIASIEVEIERKRFDEGLSGYQEVDFDEVDESEGRYQVGAFWYNDVVSGENEVRRFADSDTERFVQRFYAIDGLLWTFVRTAW